MWTKAYVEGTSNSKMGLFQSSCFCELFIVIFLFHIPCVVRYNIFPICLAAGSFLLLMPGAIRTRPRISSCCIFSADKLHNLPIRMRAQQIYIFLWKNRDENFRMKQMAFEVVLFPQELWLTTKDSQIFSYINGNVCVWTRTCQENIQTIFRT